MSAFLFLILMPSAFAQSITDSLRFEPSAQQTTLSSVDADQLSRPGCGYVDLRAGFDYSNGKDPNSALPREQGSHGWCFAYTAADLLSFHYHRKISALDVALNYFKVDAMGSTSDPHLLASQRYSATYGGDISGALTDELSAGMCLESDLPSEGYPTPPTDPDGDVARMLTRLEDAAQNFGDDEDNGRVSKLDSDCLQTVGLVEKIFPFLSQADIVQALVTRSDKDIKLQFVENLEAAVCKKSRFVPSPPPHLHSENCSAEFLGALKHPDSDYAATLAICRNVARLGLDLSLDAGQPAGVGYDMGIILNESSRGKPRKIFPHASVIAGRRWNPKEGQCEYLIRNSYGSECGGDYDVKFLNPEHCQNGNFWVSRLELQNNEFTVDALEP